MKHSNAEFKSSTPKFKPTYLFYYLASLLVIFATFGSCTKDSLDIEAINEVQQEDLLSKESPDTWQEQVDLLSRKMRRFHNFQVAQAQGYVVAVSPYVPNMGIHYLNPNRVNGEFNLLEPEILVYHPNENGKMIFGAVEYLIPVLDINNPQPHPEGFIGNEDQWHLNPAAGGWTLHAWVGLENPDGVFAPFNPLVPTVPAGN
jgi:hypothetical protein